MDWTLVIKLAVALIPVIVALYLFDRLDVFDLVSLQGLVWLIATGAGLACFAFMANGGFLDGLPIAFPTYSRYVAPFVEETIKALPIVALFAFNRIGFKLDAAVIGFGIGAGFALFENAYLLASFPDANVGAWIVRGFGTAIMHSGATAIFAIICHEFTERDAEAKAGFYRFNPLPYLPGLLVAILIHGVFNHFPGGPLNAMLFSLVLIPITLFMVFARSGKVTRQWLQSDRDSHVQALEDIRSGAFAETFAGQQIVRLGHRYKGIAPEALFAYLALHMELVLRAETVLLEREAGKEADVGPADLEAFEKLEAAQKAIGRAVLAAIRPYLPFTRNDLFEMQRLEQMARHAAGGR